MAEDHRRVEARQIVGTGMATDPERIGRLAADAQRHARSWREAPEAAFGDVLGKAPPRGELAEEPPPPAALPGGDEAPPPAASSAATAPPPAAPGPKPLRASVRAPDPRQRALHRQLDAAAAPRTPPSSSRKAP